MWPTIQLLSRSSETSHSSPTTNDAAGASHLLVLVHGYDGAPQDWDNFKAYVTSEEKGGEENITTLAVDVGSTYDGIEAGAIRAWRQTMSTLQQQQQTFTKISIIGHSLGGLYARCLVRLLSDSFVFERTRPFLFVTLATPHLGIRRTTQYSPLQVVFQAVAQRINKTTAELCLQDPSPCMLVRMTEPSFLQPLQAFQHHRLYANVWNDFQIPYTSASISCSCPYTKKDAVITTSCSSNFPSLTTYSITVQHTIQPPAPVGWCHDDTKSSEILTMYERLRVITWQRYDAIFHTLFAHEQIINKRRWFAGHDVVKHVCEGLATHATTS